MPLKAQKSLGQNFLQSQRVIDVMVETGKVDSHDCIVEAGPGKGILTETLLSCARQVIAVEKDPRLVLYLNFKFKQHIESKKLSLLTGDILQFDPAVENLQPGGYKVIANIPYYLTGQFLRYFLSHNTYPAVMVLLLQKEVAERIVARDGKESMLSLSVRAYGKPKYIETVPAELFTPRPRVDSAIVAIEDISKTFFKNTSEEHFFKILKAGFAQKRKKLSSNLSALAPRDTILGLFKQCSIPENTRAEELPLSKWKALARGLAS
ncbi:MAG: ribosomal RNA small subunit methyltransferase A [Candidatus Taylorbacteria bacterium RIFCSPHIGHO2_02_FULL_46_13]|uniref:Ribosomal RNA small subunit methyltransferase A n=1 Tax=Candidatus Taylorbacteria bacterium RIFCSPHIGHO2_02_FULL_46_13 TaxID=1802312 RepID=A0A1G2MTW9_9BACT|nr:MAG: ribosomal RNA small subunit methyltransferase A [Candidatus Taylorbacteria bacterium RIFCSPHIGHO2_02_FULL_46_13]